MKHKYSLKTKLLIATILPFIFFNAILAVSSYFLYSNNVKSITNTQILSSSKQLLNNYETYFETVISVSNSIEAKVENEDLVTNPKSTISFFDTLLVLKNEIIDTSVYSLDGVPLVSNTSYNPTIVGNNDRWFQVAIENQIINNFSKVDSKDGSSYSFTLSKYVTFNKSESKGVLKITFDFSKVVSLISQSDLGSFGHISVFDKNYNVVYSNALSNFLLAELDPVKSLVIGHEIINVNNHSFYLFSSTITNTTWTLSIFTSYDQINQVVMTFLYIITFSALGIIIVFIILMILVASSVTHPIRELQEEMTKVENLNYEENSNKLIYGSKEVMDLDKSFRQMMKRIRELASNILNEQENRRKSELKALQNQINPHFLYNTLDSIIYLIDRGETLKAEDMIVALSKFFRLSISRGKNIIPLMDEVEHARNYLLIQKMRFGDNFSYEIDINEQLKQYYVIKLILQPIIENALVHGLKNNEEGGKIVLKGYLENDLIRFDISDSGYGILPNKIEEIYASFTDDNSNNGVGIKNVFQRIRIYYGNEAKIQIKSKLDKGTCISIFIPIKGAVNDEEDI